MSKRKTKFMLVSNNVLMLQVFKDLASDVILHKTKIDRESKNKIIDFYKKVCVKLLKHNIKLPFWYKLYEILNYDFDEDTEYYIIVINGSFYKYKYQVWNRLNKKNNVHLLLLLLDTIDSKSGSAKDIKDNIDKIKFEKVYSISKEESEKYGFEYVDEHYYSDFTNEVTIKKKPKYDIYFIARPKPGRSNIINDIYKYLEKNGVKSDFEVFVGNIDDYKKLKETFEYIKGINYYNELKDYMDTLNETMNSKCILEFLQEGQNTQSLRYFEAVVFNKKLLTNNPNVINLKYYNPKYMKYFKNIEDIDIEWLKEDIKVDYHYKGDFLPKYFIENVKKDMGIK